MCRNIVIFICSHSVYLSSFVFVYRPSCWSIPMTFFIHFICWRAAPTSPPILLCIFQSPVGMVLVASIGVGAHSTFAGGGGGGEGAIFARKYMYEKLTNCPNFTWHLPEKWHKVPEFYMIFAQKCQNFHDICLKNIFFPKLRERAPPVPCLLPLRLLRMWWWVISVDCYFIESSSRLIHTQELFLFLNDNILLIVGRILYRVTECPSSYL